ncbi:MAG: outer membrane protein assembly factor BamD [Brumimicrobium sp.]|nr:outer membrane protein assembly factor BamD [Brumimicrobium sp.]MCO5269021.1 outer membrane protein assembly factor BamD [Brumimicrobium sp.]
MKTITQSILILVSVLLIVSCSDYNKILKGTDYDAKFDEANRMYDKKMYDKAINLYEQVYQYYPRTDKGEVSYFRLGEGFYFMKDYIMAGYYFGQFPSRFPVSEKNERVLFLKAICSVQNSPNYTLDQTETEIALNDLQNFVIRYPESQYVDSCNNIMDRLRLKIETKQFQAVKLYDKMDDNRAAVASAKSFLEEYPQSTFLKQVAFIHFENAYTLAINSVLSKKKERIEDAMELYSKYYTLFIDENYSNKTKKHNDRLVVELGKVNEQYAYNEIVEMYEASHSSSMHKKTYYLEETIKKFNTFAKNYPNSDLLEKARSYFKKAERELGNS